MNTSYSTIRDVYKTLDNIPMFGKKGMAAANFSLDAILRFSEAIGNPHLTTPAIHIAGTNGKGTTCRMLASVYQSAGYKTGLFTSPHLIDYRERFVINGEMIPDVKLLEFFRQHEEQINSIPLSYFELSASIAFWYFKDQNVDIAIYETGLGGRLDATNIIIPLASVITSIGMDHTEILGDSLSKIAAEKAGIIKSNRPVIVGRLPDEACKVVRKEALKQSAQLISAISEKSILSSDNMNRDEPGRGTLCERLNKPIVKSVVRCLSEQYPVSFGQLRDGLDKWGDRYPSGVSFQQLHPDLQWYFDGAHNAEAVNLLIQQLKELAPLHKWTFVLAMMEDKLNPEVMNRISQTGNLFLHSTGTDRSATTEKLQNWLPDASELPLDKNNALTEEWIQKNKSELVIFGGSFYFYQTVKQWIGNISAQ